MSKVIAIDFDGCLCEDAFPEIGEPHLSVIAQAIIEQREGAKLILWTCRVGEKLNAAVAACESWGLHFDAINENVPERVEKWGNDPRKISADEYWDDKAVGAGNALSRIRPDTEPKLKPCPFCGYEHPRIIVKVTERIYPPFAYWPKYEAEVFAWCDDTLQKNMTHGCGARAQGIVASDCDIRPAIIDSLMQNAAEIWNRRGTWNNETAQLHSIDEE